MNRKIYISNDVLSLVEYQKSDDRALYEDGLDPETQKGYNGIYVTTFEEFEKREIKQRFFAMIRLNNSNKIIGAVGISPPETEPDLAIWMFKPYRRQGYGTSAFSLATKYATEVIKIEELHAGVYPDNIGSQKMLENCGFVPYYDGNIPEKHYITGEDVTQMDYVYKGKASIIKTHDVTLYGSNSDYDIILRPLCDEHLPFLYKWNADPEVLYWTENGIGTDMEQSYDAETVHAIYGGVSQNALCFLIEVDDVPIGECWLQKMNLDNVKAMYPDSADVRRIDMAIGEKIMWGKGIGTAFIGMLVDYAFNGEYVDVLHCFCDDYNIRSRRVFEKNGFKLILSEDLPQPQKGKLEHHFRLTRQEYVERRRVRVSQDKIFELPISEIQPSQLYISDGKLRLVNNWFDETDRINFDPIPVKLYNSSYLMTDGHTRIAAAILAGWETIPVTWDDDPLDMLAYALDVVWCDEVGLRNASDDMAKNLKAQLWKLPESCRKIVEFGIGLSHMKPCGIIGIDESIAGTCHFGFGSGSGNDAPIHLDVVIGKFTVV